MSTTSQQIGKQANKVTEDLQKIGGTVRDAAQEKLEQMGKKTSECYAHGRDKIHGVASACEQYFRDRPLKSVLIAVGVGWLLGRIWKGR
jgi:ElaB/YqjD/DUF883 family membrane-anchored ribosome-binding protein